MNIIRLSDQKTPLTTTGKNEVFFFVRFFGTRTTYFLTVISMKFGEIFARIVGLPDVELEWTLALGTRKLLYLEDLETISCIKLTWESLSWFFRNFIFSAWFLKDSRESHFSAEKTRKTAHQSHVVHIS